MNTSQAPAIYLDYAATTPVDPRVVEVMLRYLGPQAHFGNPASLAHGYGCQARQAVEQAREQLAGLLGADAREVVWTSGATEANNLAIKGAVEFYRRKGRHVVTCRTEHRSVLDTCQSLVTQGARVTYLEPGKTGSVSVEALVAAIQDDTVLVSIMLVNNETGVINDVAALGAQCWAKGVKFHVDAAQAGGKLPIDFATLPIDYLTISAHKMYGPKGIGALLVRREPRARLEPLLHGGGHERGLRSGTLPTHQIAGFGEAAAIASVEMAAEQSRLLALRERMWQSLSALPKVHLNGMNAPRVSGILSVSFEGLEGESLLAAIADRLAVASGSACASADQEPSYVLRALGRDDVLAHASLRFSFGRYTTASQVETAASVVYQEVQRLREIAAFPSLAGV